MKMSYNIKHSLWPFLIMTQRSPLGNNSRKMSAVEKVLVEMSKETRINLF